MRRQRWRLFVALVVSLTAISSVMPTVAAYQATPAATPVAGGPGIDTGNMDLSVDPGADFYEFANGGWFDKVEIPGDKGSYGVFDELTDLTTDQLLGLLDELSVSDQVAPDSDEGKAVELFAQGVDIETRNAQGIEPIQPMLDEIEGIASLEEFNTFQQKAGFYWLTGLFYTFVIPDFIDSSVNGAYLSGPYYGLPNRDYYFEDDAGTQEVRDAYVATCAEFLMLTGYSEAAATAAATAVYELEKALLEPTLTREEQQDFSLFYNPRTLEELEAAYPNMDWVAYLDTLGITGTDTLVVTELRYLEALAGILETADLEALKDYVKLEVFWSFAEYLSADVESIAFDFQGGVLAGVTEQQPLEERVLEDVNSLVGDAVGQLYVAEYFPPEAKQQITELVDFLIEAYRVRLENNTWMTPEAKAVALEKLDKLGVKVGYPDKWRSYQEVVVEETYAMTALNALNVEYRRNLAQAGEPVDPNEWGALPQEVNAFYDVFNNDITFPAAILQAPFFDYEADPAVNFGGIGFVIGHEITHGFDLQGSQFDPDGNLANWWSEADAAAFQALNDRAAAQYTAIEVLPQIFVDGQITVTENVADMGGVQVAYNGLLAYLEANGDPGEIDGFTQQQRFFISAATVWREETRDESLETQVKVDVHAPAEVRATQPIRNMDEFYEVFEIEEGDPMYLAPEDRIVIW
ncbi:MAG: M13 family metallopeptidase [Thermomicrobiales bacterium]|nr:M13 family metallopeptidase [Thermomicrobiales bacterium]